MMGQYPPGSTFKIVTAAAGMDTADPVDEASGTMTLGPPWSPTTTAGVGTRRRRIRPVVQH